MVIKKSERSSLSRLQTAYQHRLTSVNLGSTRLLRRLLKANAVSQALSTGRSELCPHGFKKSLLRLVKGNATRKGRDL